MKDRIVLILLFIISAIFVFDLFIHQGRPSTFDGPTHLANIAQIHQGLGNGEFPVRWGGEFARYGWPAPQFAQQTTSYAGALYTFVTQDVVTSYNLVVFFGAFISSYFMYIFLSFYVRPLPALAGTLLFHFAPYRIMNVYIRGAIPEFFASIFIILILIALYLALKKERTFGYYLLSISVALLMLTHLFMFVVGSVLFVAYGVYLLIENRNNVKLKIAALGISLGISIGLASYYIIPLFMEVKYLYYGGAAGHFVEGHFLTWKNYFFEQWYYFFQGDIDVRGHVHMSGIIETFVLIISTGYVGLRYVQKKSISPLLPVFLVVGGIYIFLTTSWSEFFYKQIDILGSIQHPWRMLTGFIIVPPILLSLKIDKLPKKYLHIILVVLIAAIGIVRFPQLYGKNYLLENQNIYYKTYDNLHGTIMNTIWMGEVRDYPFQDVPVEVFEGDGEISQLDITNSKHSFVIQAKTDVKVVDYTFYFPGWKSYIDKVETQIQFQDPNYRGVITYQVPRGTHEIITKFTNTKPRILGNTLSLFSFIVMSTSILIYPVMKKKFHIPL